MQFLKLAVRQLNIFRLVNESSGQLYKLVVSMVELPTWVGPDYHQLSRLKTAKMCLHPLAECEQFQKSICKIANFSLLPIELQELNFKNVKCFIFAVTRRAAKMFCLCVYVCV